MRKLLLTLLLIAAGIANATSIFYESFEYANHDGETPVGWVSDDSSWVCGYLEKDHNRKPHEGNWYAYANANDSWMFMELIMSPDLKYRYSFWAISDGEYDLEIWAGNGPSASQMTDMLVTMTINSDDYQRFSEYIETIAMDYQYFGIHALAHEGASYFTIDDIEVEMVGKFDIIVNPASINTIVAPGEQVEFHCRFTNLGYEPANVIITCYSEYFTDVHLFIDGTACTTFHAEPYESIELTGVATLSPDIEPGTTCWVDIVFSLDCDCATTMFTLMATAGYDSTDEIDINTISIYPNPSNGNVTIEGNGTVMITNTLGQVVLTKEIIDNEMITLERGVYFVTYHGATYKLIVR